MEIELEQKPMLGAKSTIDSIINSYGLKYEHFILITQLCLVIFIDSTVIIFLTLTLNSGKEFYQANNYGFLSISFIYFMTFLVGNLLESWISKYISHALVIRASCFALVILNIIPIFYHNVYIFGTIIFLDGLLIGFQYPILFQLVTDFLPLKFRLPILVIVWTLFTFGVTYMSSCLYICFPELLAKDYPYFLIFLFFPFLITFMFSFLFKIESPRYLIANGKHAEGVRVLISTYNLKELPVEDENRIIEHETRKSNILLKGSVTELFNSKYLRTTIILVFVWLSINIFYIGVAINLQNLVEKLENQNSVVSNKKMLWQILVSTFICFFNNVPVMFLPEYLGRIKTMTLGLGLVTILNVLGIIWVEYFYIFLGLMNFFIVFAFDTSASYTLELYPTKLRDIAFGFHIGFTRFIGALCIYLIYYLAFAYARGALIFNLFFFGVAFILSFFLKHETKGEALDEF